MSDEVAFDAHQHAAHVVVGPVQDGGFPSRSVEILGTKVGTAHRLADVLELLRRAGLDDVHYTDPDLVNWQGGGPDVWA